MATHGKRYLTAEKLVNQEQAYPLREAVGIVKRMATAKFDETLELHFRLGIDPRHSDQQVRSTVLLPHGLGKTVRVLVFAEGDDARIAQEAGADLIGNDELINRIQKENFLDFDATLAVPSMMTRIGRIARILGPRGLMPNVKTGTVVPPEDLTRALNELKAGRVEFRNDKTGNLHVPLGKASFDETRLYENAQSIIDAVNRVKPTAIKGIYIKKVVLCSTMSPGVRVDTSAAAVAANTAAASANIAAD
jgi:large subunit ribosomal protein L1